MKTAKALFLDIRGLTSIHITTLMGTNMLKQS